MLSLHTNAASLSTQNSLAANNKNLTASMSKLGTGLRVNSAMDDAAGLQIATRLNAQSRGMQVAQKNTQNGISMLQTAEGSMSEINNMLLRMKDLATESANGTSTEKDRAALQAEYSALGEEIGNILKNTSFAGTKLFSDDAKNIGSAGNLKAGGTLGTAAGIKFQVGATQAETIAFAAGSEAGSLTKLMTALSSISNKIGDQPETKSITGTAPTDTSAVDTNIAALAGVTWVAGTHTAYADQGAMDAASAAAQDRLDAFDAYTAAEANIVLFNTQWADGGVTVGGNTYATEDDLKAAQTQASTDLDTFAATYNTLAIKTEVPASTEIATSANASAKIDALTAVINDVGTFRSDLGAVANRLDHTFNNLSNMITNTETAKGRIMDVDYATETSNMTKNQMLMQASSAMLKQSNSMSQMVSSLLQ